MSVRIAIATTSNDPTWNKLVTTIAKLRQGREDLFELNRIIAAYATDTALGTAIGAATADATSIRNLVTQAAGEMCTTVSTQLNVGNTSGTAQLIDSLN